MVFKFHYVLLTMIKNVEKVTCNHKNRKTKNKIIICKYQIVDSNLYNFLY